MTSCLLQLLPPFWLICPLPVNFISMDFVLDSSQEFKISPIYKTVSLQYDMLLLWHLLYPLLSRHFLTNVLRECHASLFMVSLAFALKINTKISSTRASAHTLTHCRLQDKQRERRYWLYFVQHIQSLPVKMISK